MTAPLGALAWARAVYGAALLGARLDARAAMVARVLGVRELVQAGLTGTHPGRRRLLAGVGVDALHGATMIGLGSAAIGGDRLRVTPAHRRLARGNARTAALWAGLGLLAARRASGEG